MTLQMGQLAVSFMARKRTTPGRCCIETTGAREVVKSNNLRQSILEHDTLTVQCPFRDNHAYIIKAPEMVP